MTAYTVAPLSDTSWCGQQGAESTRFSSKWPATEDLLVSEVEAIRGHDLVLELAVTPSDLRLDGTLRANARTPGRPVGVSFQTAKHGPLTYRFYSSWAHQGPDWQHNVRAIALTLQSLRAVDRYGAAAGAQYSGFKALGAGRAMPASHMTSDQAREVITSIVGPVDRPWDTRFKMARAEAHPDRNGGDRTLWDRLEQAGVVLGLVT